MNVQKKKTGRKVNKGQLLLMAVSVLVGAGFGFLLVPGGNVKQMSAGVYALGVSLHMAALLLALGLQLILHEAGHLLFGLLSGYRFSSFRVGSLMWVNDGSALRLKRLSLAGTGGQCLMSPPPLKDGAVPYVWYNLGGSILNLLTAAGFWALYASGVGGGVYTKFFLFSALVGVFFGLLNGIPLRLGLLDNDGRNALSLGKNKEAMFAFWAQLMVSDAQTRGQRLKDMPDAWFTLPTEEGMNNAIVCTLAVFHANRLMDRQNIAEAKRYIGALLLRKTAVVGVYRQLLSLDALFCELLLREEGAPLGQPLTKEQTQLMKQMKRFPAILRTQYALALLG